MRDAKELFWYGNNLAAAAMPTLGMILRTNGLPKLQGLIICGIGSEVMGMQALFEGFRLGGATSLKELGLEINGFGPAGAEALAAALCGGAVPKLELLFLGSNTIGGQGVTALAAPLRKLPALRELQLSQTELDDDGVASLFANLGKDDFKALERIALDSVFGQGHARNKLGEKSYATLTSVLDEGAMPKLENLVLPANGASQAALVQAAARRHVQLVFAE